MGDGASSWTAWESLAGRWAVGAFAGLLGAVLLAGAVALIGWTLGRRLPTAARAWLWWLVCFKLVLAGALWWMPHAPLAVPASLLRVSIAARPAAVPGMGRDDASIPTGLAGPHAPLAKNPSATAAAAAVNVPRWPGVPTLLMLVWAVGVMLVIGKTALSTVRLHRALRADCEDLANDALAGEARLLAVALGLQNSPRLLSSPAATAPLVVGLRRATIFLPPDFADTLSPAERRMALAHELAHVRRGDLWRDLAPLAARALWWFLPVLPGLAWREWATAREAACDALALQVTESTPGEYSRLLLKIVRGDACPAASALPAALGATASFYTLRTRLELVRGTEKDEESITRGGSRVRPLRRGAAALFAMAGAVALVPWRPVTGEAAAERGAPSVKAALADALPFPPPPNQGDVADVPAWDLKAGGDPAKRYLLIGLPDGAATPPPGGYRLLVVLPGGDGGVEFNGWVRRIRKRALGPEYIVVELVAPRWDDRQASEVVWPTRTNPWPSMRFPTEAFVGAVVRDVARRVPVNAQHVYALGWASAGPPVYAAGLTPEAPITGAFVAMSVYDHSWLPSPAGASSGKPFFLLHPEDAPIVPLAMAERAQRELSAAGAPVELVTYQGGYGWHGDVYAQIRRGVAYLESHSSKKSL